jgi:hypothetical protein
MHEDFSREEHVKAGSDRGFGQVFAGFFALVSALSWWRGHTGWHYLLPIAVAFLVVAYTYPSLLAPLNRLWLKFGLLFFITITPIGLVMRAFGKDFLRLRLDRGAKSYWIEREPPGPPPQSMKNQF